MSMVSFSHRPAEEFLAQQSTTSNRYLFGALLLVVLLSPLPFGSAEIWAWGSLAIVTAGLLAAWAILVATARIDVAVPFAKVRVPALLFGIVVLWTLIQTAPFTPQSWHHPIWAESAKALGLPYTGRISLDPDETMSALARLLWYAAIFWLALQIGRDRSSARVSVSLITWTGLAYATYGLVVKLTGGESVLWVKKFIYHTDVTSTFINKNSYAAFAGISLVCATALLVDRVLAIPRQEVVKAGKFAAIVNALIARSWFLILTWMVVLTAIILSNSRAGLVSCVIGLIAFIVTLSFSKAVPSRLGRWFGLVMVLGIAGFFAFGGETVDKRFAFVVEQSKSRIAIYETTLEMVKDSPLLGMGLGTYPQVFQLYRKSDRDHQVPARRAHNTYLENAAELGIPATLCLVLAVGGLCLMCLSGVRHRRSDVVIPAIGVAVTVLLGLHSFIDFSLQIPAVAATYVFIMGLGCAQSWSTRRRRMDRAD